MSQTRVLFLLQGCVFFSITLHVVTPSFSQAAVSDTSPSSECFLPLIDLHGCHVSITNSTFPTKPLQKYIPVPQLWTLYNIIGLFGFQLIWHFLSFSSTKNTMRESFSYFSPLSIISFVIIMRVNNTTLHLYFCIFLQKCKHHKGLYN